MNFVLRSSVGYLLLLPAKSDNAVDLQTMLNHLGVSVTVVLVPGLTSAAVLEIAR